MAQGAVGKSLRQGIQIHGIQGPDRFIRNGFRRFRIDGKGAPFSVEMAHGDDRNVPSGAL